MKTLKVEPKKKNISLNMETLETGEILATVKEMRSKIRTTMKFHIGKEEAISPAELFEKVYGFSPFVIEGYRREYWWNVLKKVMKGLRKEGEIFIIIERNKLYVLKTEEELLRFKKMIERDIISLIGLAKKAKEWVRNKKYNKF